MMGFNNIDGLDGLMEWSNEQLIQNFIIMFINT